MVHKGTFKKEVEFLVLLEVIQLENDSEWGYPPFAQPKSKSYRVHFIRNFRNLNRQLKQKPYPMPKINEILLKWEGFHYYMSFDLNME